MRNLDQRRINTPFLSCKRIWHIISENQGHILVQSIILRKQPKPMQCSPEEIWSSRKITKKKVRVICKYDCEWKSYHTKKLNEEICKLRKVVDIHNYGRDYNVKMLTTKWLSRMLHNSLKDNLNMKIRDIKEKTQRKWNARVNKRMIVRARFAAKDMVDAPFL